MRVNSFLKSKYKKFKENQLTRIYYLLLIFSGILVIGILLQIFIYKEKQDLKILDDIKRENVIKSRIFEEHTKRSFIVVHQILLDIEQNYKSNPKSFNLASYAKKSLIGYKDILIQLSIADEYGNLMQLSDGNPKEVNISDRAFFKYHREHDDPNMHISRPVLGKIKNTWMIPVTIRMNNPDGSFDGLIIASVNPYYFTNFFKQVIEGRIYLVNDDGFIIASWTDNQTDELGKDYSKTNAFIMSRYANQGIEISKSIFDDVERVRAFKVVEPYKIVVIVTLAKNSGAIKDNNFTLYFWYSIIIILFIINFVYWITKNLKHEQKLHMYLSESEQKANTILKTVTEGILVIRNFKIVYFNASVLKILKATPEFINRKSILEFIHEEDKGDLVYKYKKQSLNKIFRFEFRALQMDKEVIWLHAETVPISWQGEKAILACFYDITENKKWADLEKKQYIKMESMNYALQNEISERKALEEERLKIVTELKNKNQELEKFVYTVSHDLRSPLITIKGFSNFVHRDLSVNDIEKAHKDIEKIEFSADRMSNLIDDLLELSRAGRVMRPFVKVEMNLLVSEVLQILQFNITNNSAEILIDNSLHEVIGDNLKIRLVYQNLIENAIKYKHPERKPVIHIGYNEQEAYFYVKDNGIGIKNDDYDKIFDVFTKISSESKGSGIGLSIVRRIIDLHQGNIKVYSTQDIGTEFRFTLSNNS